MMTVYKPREMLVLPIMIAIIGIILGVLFKHSDVGLGIGIFVFLLGIIWFAVDYSYHHSQWKEEQIGKDKQGRKTE